MENFEHKFFGCSLTAALGSTLRHVLPNYCLGKNSLTFFPSVKLLVSRSLFLVTSFAFNWLWIFPNEPIFFFFFFFFLLFFVCLFFANLVCTGCLFLNFLVNNNNIGINFCFIFILFSQVIFILFLP